MKDSIFIGRTNSLKKLENLLTEAENGLGKVILINGEAGSGKTELVRKFFNQIKNKSKIITAISECVDKEGINSYSPFKELIIQLNTPINDSKEATIKKIKQFLVDAGPQWLSAIPVIGNFATIGTATIQSFIKNFRNKTQESIIKTESEIHLIFENEFRRASQNQTLVAFLDDLQWCDTSSLNLFFSLARSIRQKPFKILLIGSYRQSEIETGRNKITENGQNVMQRHPFADKLNELRNYTKKESHITRTDEWLSEINIEPFTLHEISELLLKKFPENCFNDTLASQLLNLTKGHILFIIEIINSLVEKGYIYKDESNQYRIKQFELNELPTSINGVIAERIERLDKELKKILEYASVEGDIFRVKSLEQILKIDELDLLDNLEELSKKHKLIFSAGTEKLKDILLDLFSFSNAIVRKYIYENMESSRRRALHRRLSEILKNLYSDDFENNAEIKNLYLKHLQIGNGLIDGITLEISAPQKSDEIEQKQIENSIKEELIAAKKAFEQYAMNECITIIDKVLGFISQQVDLNTEIYELRYEALLLRIRSYDWLGLYEKSLNTALQLLEYAKEKNQNKWISIALLRCGISNFHIGNYDQSEIFLNQAYSIEKNTKNDIQIIEIIQYIGRVKNEKSMFDAAISELNKAIDITQKLGDKIKKGETLNFISQSYRFKGEYEKAIGVLNDALQCFNQDENHIQIANSYNQIGLCLVAKGEYDSAYKYFQHALEIDKQLNDRVNLANRYNNIGLCFEGKGDYDKAIESYKKTVEIDETLNNKAKSRITITNIGDIYRLKGDYNTAIEYIEEAEEICKELNDHAGLSSVYTSFGNIYYEMNNTDKALEFYKKAIQIDLNSNDKMGLSSSYINIGNVYYSLNKYDEALKYMQKGLDIVESVGDTMAMAVGYNNIGNIYFDKKDFERALNFYEKAEKINKELNNIVGLSLNYNNLNLVYQELKNYKLAIKYAKKALELSETIDDKVNIALHASNLAHIFGVLKDYRDAFQNYIKALKIYNELGLEMYEASNLTKAARLLFEEEKYEKAKKFFIKAVNIYKKNEEHLLIAENEYFAGITCSLLEETSEALDLLNNAANIYLEDGYEYDYANCNYQKAMIYYDEKDFATAKYHFKIAYDIYSDLGYDTSEIKEYLDKINKQKNKNDDFRPGSK